MYDFLLTRFRDMASDMVTSGVAFSLSHQGVRNLMIAAADGKIKIR